MDDILIFKHTPCISNNYKKQYNPLTINFTLQIYQKKEKTNQFFNHNAQLNDLQLLKINSENNLQNQFKQCIFVCRKFSIQFR